MPNTQPGLFGDEPQPQAPPTKPKAPAATKPSKIPAIFNHLARRATESDETQAHQFGHGARLSVRVRAGVLTLTISRVEKLVGDQELIVFRRDCGVPIDAERKPAEGQGSIDRNGQTWRYIAYSWKLEGGAR